MPYEIIMIDPVAAAGVCEANDIESYELCTNHLQRWKTYDVDHTNAIESDSGELIGAYISISGATAVVRFGLTPRDNGFVVKRISALHPTDKVMQAFGSFDDQLSVCQDTTLRLWFNDILFDSSLNSYESVGTAWSMRMRAMQPIRSKINTTKISIYQTIKDADNDRHVALTPGKAIRKMFPEFSDADLEKVVDMYRAKFTSRKYTLKEATDPDSFTHAYSHTQADMENPRTTMVRKASCNSCMRYEFEHLPKHPCSIYGSGDFKIVWVEDNAGLIAGRCVVYTKPSRPSAGPIYGVCEKSMDLIQEHLDSINAKVYESGACWIGAKLLKVPHADGGFVGPYLDLCPQRMTEENDYLIIDDCGEVDASSYHGILNGCYTTCCECDCPLDQDDYYYSDYNDSNYCESCYNNEHTYCDYEGETVHNSEMSEVWTETRFGYSTEMVSDNARDNQFNYCTDGEYWHEDSVRYCESEDQWISPKTFKADYFESDWDGEIYPNDQLCKTEDGESVSKDEIGDDWVMDEFSVWKKVEEEDE
tara:strand:- start:72 stop:1673 length:1602 start_codon:yes stop_codon:yes gene_type:complete